MKRREINYIKKIARERGGGEEKRRPNKWPAIKRGKPRKNRAKSHPKIRIGRTILIKNNEAL